MALIALASLKGSPGVTTTALALGASTGHDVIVAELDPAGGDIAARFSRTFEPGLISLAAASRRPSDEVDLRDHCQSILGELPVILGPVSGDRAEAALRLLSERHMWQQIANDDALVLADCGRLDTHSAAIAVVEASSELVVVCRPVLSELQHLHARLPALRRLAKRLSLAIVGGGTYGTDEIRDSLEIEVCAALPRDRDTSRLLSGTSSPRRGLARLPLLRAASAVMQRLAAPPPSSPPADTLIKGIREAAAMDAASTLVSAT